MSNKLRIKIGQVEVEYEGSEEFIKDQLPKIIREISGLTKAQPSLGDDSTGGVRTLQLTTNTIAARLQCSSGPELIVASCAALHFTKGLRSYKRKEILTEMKSAANYFKSSYGNSLSNYLRTLVSNGTLVETAKHTFSLHANTIRQLEPKLAER